MRVCRLAFAIAADPPKPETVMRRAKAEFLSHLVLQHLDLCREKFDHAAAFGADHVVVMLVIIMMLVIGLVITEPDLTREPSLGQQTQRAIDRRKAHRGVFFLDESIKILAGEMLFGPQKCIKYQVTLARAAQSQTLEMLKKYAFFGTELVFFSTHR